MNLDNTEIYDAKEALLGWYSKHARVLPWRVPEESSQLPDPYHVWLSEIMLQQTTVNAVVPYYQKFIERWPSVHDLAAAPLEEVMKEWAGLGYYSRARNLHACAQIVSKDLGGVFPEDLKSLKALPGIGEYTSTAIRAIAFNKPATVVDGNVERVIARFFRIDTPMPKAKKDIKQKAALFFEQEEERPSALAQGFMDLGAAICTPKNPKCVLCPVQENCEARREGDQELYPVKAPKKVKPQKHGYVYWLEGADGSVLLERRPDKGMLGGMVGLPTSEWVEKPGKPAPVFQHDAGDILPASVRHSFTHFDLELVPVRIRLNEGLDGSYFLCKQEELDEIGFPTLFKKALSLFSAS